jgi:hypothetical protein
MGCAGFGPIERDPYHPRIGMTYDDWLKHLDLSDGRSLGQEIMVGAEGDTEVWTLIGYDYVNHRESPTGIFYYFEHGQLVKIDQGQLMQQRTQLEIINK